MRQVLNNEELERSFHKDGFVTIELLNKDEIEQLKLLIIDLNKGHIESSTLENSTYKLSYFNDDLEYKHRVFKELSVFFQPKVDKFLKGYKPLIINIFDKEPGVGEVPIHQNWTFVDEDEYTSVSVWIPLIDVSHDNGTLEVVKGSHKVLCKFRSPTIPWVFDELNEQLKDKYLEPFEFSVGHAAIIDDGILHWSSDNKTAKVRTAIQLIMVPDDATPIHYHSNEKGEADVIKVDKDFFMKFNNMRDIPTGYPIIGKRKISIKKLNEDEFKEVVSVNNPAILLVD